MRILGLLASVLAAMLLTAACGGGDDAPEQTENDLAEAMLLVLGDLPAGEEWEYEPPSDSDEDDEPNPFDQCDRDNEDSIIGTADGGDFSRRGASEISQDIRIFDSVDSLAQDLDDIEDRGDCMADLVSDGALDTDLATYADFRMDRVEYRQFGDDSRTYRIEMTATLIDEPNVPDPFKIYLDEIFVEIDTVGMLISASDVFEPYDEDEVGRIAAMGEEKVRAALANDPIGND